MLSMSMSLGIETMSIWQCAKRPQAHTYENEGNNQKYLQQIDIILDITESLDS